MKKLAAMFENVSMFPYLKTLVLQYLLVVRLHFL